MCHRTRGARQDEIMADAFRGPDPLAFNGDVAEKWRKFEWEYEILITAAHGDKPSRTPAFIVLDVFTDEVGNFSVTFPGSTACQPPMV